METDCQEHRKSMELLGLKMRLQKGISDPKEREEVEARIRLLETELKLA